LILQTQIESFFNIVYGPFKLFYIFDAKKKTQIIDDYAVDQEDSAVTVKNTTTYGQRKRKTILFASKQNVPFQEGYKKDDIADAYCQAIAFIWSLFSYEIIS